MCLKKKSVVSWALSLEVMFLSMICVCISKFVNAVNVQNCSDLLFKPTEIHRNTVLVYSSDKQTPGTNTTLLKLLIFIF